ncbi:unnamed protein product [Camellia sinensis]
MRKLTSVDTNGTARGPILLPSPLSSPMPSPSPSPSPSNNFHERGMLFFEALSIESPYDLVTLSLVSCLILLSILSFSLIFHLRLKSRSAKHLQNFNTLWSIRLLLVWFMSFWSLNEILRLPFFQSQYLYPFMSSLTLSQEVNICKVHNVLSLGVFEPGFLITLLFLVNSSIKKRNPHDIGAIALIFLTCLPVFVLQLFVVFFSPIEAKIPHAFETSYAHSLNGFENMFMCTYPLFSTLVFAAFGIAYSLGFLFSYWRVISLVINKGTRVRIHILSFSIFIALPMQILLLTLSSFWRPENPAYGGVMFGMFLNVSLIAVVGEGIMVIKPIADALAANRDCCRWNTSVRLQTMVVERPKVVDGNR